MHPPVDFEDRKDPGQHCSQDPPDDGNWHRVSRKQVFLLLHRLLILEPSCDPDTLSSGQISVLSQKALQLWPLTLDSHSIFDEHTQVQCAEAVTVAPRTPATQPASSGDEICHQSKTFAWQHPVRQIDSTEFWQLPDPPIQRISEELF